MAVSNIRDRSGQEVTSVLQNTARVESFLYFSRRDWASGRRVRSARRTEQPRERRREVNEKFMPWGEVSGSFSEEWVRKST
jgi:hypothetical protein